MKTVPPDQIVNKLYGIDGENWKLFFFFFNYEKNECVSFAQVIRSLI